MKRLLWLALLLPVVAFGQTKISALPSGTTLGGTESIPMVQSATTVKEPVSAIGTWFAAQISGDCVVNGSYVITCSKVNGASVPASANCVGTNASSQITAGCPEAVNAQTGTTYTVASTDCGKQLTFSNAASIAVTVPQANGSFASCQFDVTDLGAGTATLTPTTSTINGSASLAIAQNRQCTVNSDGTNWQVIGCTALVTGGSGACPINVQIFTTTGANTWTKPAACNGSNPQTTRVILIGGGGGGGGGAMTASGTSNSGGGGGGSGFAIEATYPTASLGATETVTVATGGSAGTAATVAGAGGNGGNGGATSFGTTPYLYAYGGGGGQGGQSNATSYGGGSGSGTAGSSNQYGVGPGAVNGGVGLGGQYGEHGSGGGGGANASVGQSAGLSTIGPGAGGGGGGVSTGPAPQNGGTGGDNSAFPTVASGGSGSVTTAGAGGAGSNPSGSAYFPGTGGGGGGSTTTGTAGVGGAGGIGAGGGGGGSCITGGTCAAGGAGGNGKAIVITTY